MNGLKVGEWRRGPGEMEPTVLVRHRLTLQLNGPVPFEALSEGRYRTVRKRPGEVFVTPVGTRVGLRWLADHHYIMVDLDPAIVAGILADRDRDRDRPVALVERPGSDDPHVSHLMLALRSDAAEGHPSGRLYTEALVRALVLRLGAGYAATDEAPPGPAPEAIRRVRDYLEAHLSDNPSLADLAEVAGLSPHHLARSFARATGLPPHRYLITRRLELAKSLLAHSDRPIAAIACDLGFSSQGHFHRAFRKHVGAAPGVYRREV